MYCAAGRVLSNSLTLCVATSNSYFSAINRSYIDNNPEMSGIWCVAKAWYF